MRWLARSSNTPDEKAHQDDPAWSDSATASTHLRKKLWTKVRRLRTNNLELEGRATVLEIWPKYVKETAFAI
jgi:hypothetical protein